jgi:EpsI family protein
MLEPLAFLRHRTAQLVTAILVVEIAAFYWAPRAEYVPNPPPLTELQRNVGPWTMVQEMRLDRETQEFLKANDTVSRAYTGPGGPITFFAAFFKSQRGGVTPHSPKICLPGAGWTPVGSRIISVDIPGQKRAIPVNRYVVRRGENQSLVLYWYRTAHYAVADEYLSKLYLMYEGLRYHRSDEAVFRIIVPISGSEEAAEEAAIRFLQALDGSLQRHIWAEV